LKVSKPLVLFYTLWFVTFFSMFSAVAGIHQFYTSSLALPVAVITAGAVALAVREIKHWHIVVLLNVAGLSALYFASLNGGYMKWASYLQVAVIVVVVGAIFTESSKLRRYFLPVAILAGLVFTPAAWAFDARNHTKSINPIAGNADAMGGGFGGRGMGGPGGNFRPPGAPPQGGNFSGGGFGGGFGQQDNSATIEYLTANRDGAKFLLVTFGAQSAASYITSTGENVLPIGGFDGQDPTPTLKKFKELVAAGDIKYVLSESQDGRGGQVANTEIKDWVSANCTLDANAPTSSLYICGQ
jgi:4-amino-4-deoxy-L-arabinose transferase-like glycosyltransferase